MCTRVRLHVFALILIVSTSGCSSLRGVRNGFEQPQPYENGALILDVPTLKDAPSPLHPFKTLAKYWRIPPRTLLKLKALTDNPDLFASEKADILLQSLARSELYVHAGPLGEEDVIERLRYGVPVLVVVAKEPFSPSSMSWWLLYGHSKNGKWMAAGFDSQGWMDGSDVRAWRQNALNLTVIVCPEKAVRWPLNPGEEASWARHFERKDDWLKAFEIRSDLSEKTNHSGDWVLRGNAAREATLIRESRTAYEQAVELHPENPAALNNLSFLLLETGEEAELALEYIDKALRVMPENPHYLDTRGFALMELGRFDEASSSLEKARARSKSLPLEEQIEIHQRLARCFEALGMPHLVRQVESQILPLQNRLIRQQKATKFK